MSCDYSLLFMCFDALWKMNLVIAVWCVTIGIFIGRLFR